MIDSTTGYQVWADDFVGELKDVFSLQEQTALKIAQALNLRLSPQEQNAVQQRYTQNPQAYEALLVGRALLGAPTAENLEAARKDFEQALQLDPNYAPALAGLSYVEGEYYRDIDSNPAYLQRAEQLAQRALAIDPALPDGHVAIGRTYALRYEYARAADEFREAIRLEPQNVQGWYHLSWALGYEQPPDALEAEKAARQAIRLQPSLAQAHYQLGRALLPQGRYQMGKVAQQAKLLAVAAQVPRLLGMPPMHRVHGYSGTWDVQNSFSLWHGIEVKPPDKVRWLGKTLVRLRDDGEEGYGIQFGQLKVELGQYRATWNVANEVIRAAVGKNGSLSMRVRVGTRSLDQPEIGTPPSDRVHEPLPSHEWDLVLKPEHGAPRTLVGEHTYPPVGPPYLIAKEYYTYADA